jgi:cyclic-di-GMP-binding protein
MPSFDIVSEIDTNELKSAVDNAVREVGTRFDFRGVEAKITLEDLKVTLKSESEFQVRQLEDLFRGHCVKRQVDCAYIDTDEKILHSGKFYSLSMVFKQGIEQQDAKEITKQIKDSKAKVQTSIQGDKIRVTGKKRDDLQEVIALLKKADLPLPVQFNNFRD